MAYLYPEPSFGPPVSPPEAEIAWEADQSDFRWEQPTVRYLQQQRQGAVYYAPGDNLGVDYSNGTECANAQHSAGDVGICLVK
jgi:hypothetical protein